MNTDSYYIHCSDLVKSHLLVFTFCSIFAILILLWVNSVESGHIGLLIICVGISLLALFLDLQAWIKKLQNDSIAMRIDKEGIYIPKFSKDVFSWAIIESVSFTYEYAELPDNDIKGKIAMLSIQLTTGETYSFPISLYRYAVSYFHLRNIIRRFSRRKDFAKLNLRTFFLG